MSTSFEEELGNVLGEFKCDRLDYADAVLKIEQLVIRHLGFSLYHANEAVVFSKMYVKDEPTAPDLKVVDND